MMSCNRKIDNIAYLSFRKAMVSEVRNAATIASGLRRKPNTTIQNVNVDIGRLISIGQYKYMIFIMFTY